MCVCELGSNTDSDTDETVVLWVADIEITLHINLIQSTRYSSDDGECNISLPVSSCLSVVALYYYLTDSVLAPDLLYPSVIIQFA